MKKVSWLDSCRQPSAIHITSDEAETTLCGGHAPMRNHHTNTWVISKVPKQKSGRSNKCSRCFSLAHSQGRKSVNEWISMLTK
jgi:hypothetical protein